MPDDAAPQPATEDAFKRITLPAETRAGLEAMLGAGTESETDLSRMQHAKNFRGHSRHPLLASRRTLC